MTTQPLAANQLASTAHRIEGRDGEIVYFTGVRLGSGSSQTPDKDRWFEVDIYRSADGEYLLHTRGCSRLAGEETKRRIVRTRSAFEIIELLTVNHNGKTYIPRSSARALAQAANWDTKVRDAYVNRAVV